jgi:hypothetical protein
MVIGAVVLILAESTGANLPLSPFFAVTGAVLVVIAAGITNPGQFWIHWINAGLAMLGTVIFGLNAVQQYRAGASPFDPSFTYVEALTLLSLLALYFATQTIRGLRVPEKHV